MLFIDIRPLRADRFAAFVDGKLVVRSSRVPFLDAARALCAAGWPAETRITMRHPDRSLSLRAILGKAAALTVEEGNRTAYFRRWKSNALAEAAE